MPEHTPAPTPSRAVYGFALYLSSKMFLVLYLIWALVPESWFISLGITYLPQRYWALVIPIFLLTVFATFIFIVYPSINLCMTPNFNELRTIKDSNSNGTRNGKIHNIKEYFIHSEKNMGDECSCKNKSKCKKQVYEDIPSNTCPLKMAVPSVEDLDITDVSRFLYSK